MGRLRNMASVYLSEGNGLWMLYRVGSRVANNKYIGTAGGHFEKDELNDARACVLRELREECGLTEDDVAGLRLRYITLRYKNGEIRQNYYFFAQRKSTKPMVSTEGSLQWFPMDALPGLDMPVSAKAMILHYLQEGQFDNRLYGAVTQEKDTVFVSLEDFPG